jgi:cell division septum initiation protein DivIVA
MRHDRLLALALAAALAAGCGAVDDWSGLKRTKEAPPAPVADDSQIIAEYLATLDRLGRGGVAVQAEILETTRAAYLGDPSTRNRLTYAFVLAVPGHAGTDSAGARKLLGEALATPETLLSSERALAELMVRELDARLALTQENATLRSDTTTGERDRIASLNRRLQQETAEKERLRRELEEAKAKLEAIAALEGGANGRKP